MDEIAGGGGRDSAGGTDDDIGECLNDDGVFVVAEEEVRWQLSGSGGYRSSGEP